MSPKGARAATGCVRYAFSAVPSFLLSLTVETAHLELPVGDLEPLSSELRCTLTERRRELTLQATTGRLVFDRLGALALLREVRITDDPEAVFTVTVLGRLLGAYEGELHGSLVTQPADLFPSRVTVRRGESSHPLFGTVMASGGPALTKAQLEAVEALLEEARRHWQRWLGAKAGRGDGRSR
jgi:hypothetical protein